MSPFITRTRGSSLSALALSLALIASPAFAQDSTVAEPQGGALDEEAIVVTGSRIARTGFDQPTPVTVLGADQIERQAATNISQVLNDLPSFRAQSTPATSAIFLSNLGAATADLRGLGSNRTLVLIDGRRVVPATVSGGSFTPAGAVDLNLVPSSLVQRADVVTGGASAAYGSDAVAGVVNIILDTSLQGLKGSAQYGITDAGDNEEYQLSLAGGTSFADGRGHIIAGVEYSDSKGSGDCYSRDWCSQSYNTITNPFVAGSTTQRVAAGQAATIIVPNARTSTSTVNGIITSTSVNGVPTNTALRGTEFNPDGSTRAHDYGTYYGTGIFQSGGGDPRLAFYENFAISAPVQRINAFSHLKFEVSDKTEFFLEGSYGRVKGNTIGAQRRDLGNIVITRDNAFLPAPVLARMVTAGVTSFNMGRIWNDIGPQTGEVERETYRIVTGANFDMWDDWSLNAYYQYGRTNYSQIGYNTTITPRMTQALDAVNIGGNIVCRSATARAAGCQPLNPFGAGNTSPAARAYVTGTATQETQLTQHVLSISGQGTLLQGWAGPIKMATGVEYRKDIARGTADPISTALQFYTSPGAPISGDIDVIEAFGELVVPVFEGAELNGAVRRTDYSSSGSVTTWKVGADWAATDWLRLRGTRSRDIRAANIFELYGPLQSSFQSVNDPRPRNPAIPAQTESGGQVLTSVVLGGTPTLAPEVADTWTVGAVFQPDLGSAGRLRVSVDYYNIKLKGAISTLGAQVVVNDCEAGVTVRCADITRNANGGITSIRNLNLNLGTINTSGWDIEALYTLPVGLFGGQISLRGLATIVDDLTTESAGVAVDRAGMNGSPTSQPSGVPRYTVNGYLSFNSDKVSAQVQVRHIAGGTYNASLIGPGQNGYDPRLPNSVSDNYIAPWTYVNINGSFAVWSRDEQKVEIFGVINNLFDRDPPVDAPSSFGPTNNVLYDVVGRTYKIGARFKF